MIYQLFFFSVLVEPPLLSLPVFFTSSLMGNFEGLLKCYLSAGNKWGWTDWMRSWLHSCLTSIYSYTHGNDLPFSLSSCWLPHLPHRHDERQIVIFPAVVSAHEGSHAHRKSRVHLFITFPFIRWIIWTCSGSRPSDVPCMLVLPMNQHALKPWAIISCWFKYVMLFSSTQ